MKIQHLRYHLILRPEPEGGFTVIVPALPGCVTYGKDIQQAKEMAIDAIKGYMASLRKHKDPIPSDNESVIASVEMQETKGRRTAVYA